MNAGKIDGLGRDEFDGAERFGEDIFKSRRENLLGLFDVGDLPPPDDLGGVGRIERDGDGINKVGRENAAGPIAGGCRVEVLAFERKMLSQCFANFGHIGFDRPRPQIRDE